MGLQIVRPELLNETYWLVITINKKWPERHDARAFESEKKARMWAKKLGGNIVSLALVPVEVSVTLQEV